MTITKPAGWRQGLANLQRCSELRSGSPSRKEAVCTLGAGLWLQHTLSSKDYFFVSKNGKFCPTDIKDRVGKIVLGKQILFASEAATNPLRGLRQAKEIDSNALLIRPYDSTGSSPNATSPLIVPWEAFTALKVVSSIPSDFFDLSNISG